MNSKPRNPLILPVYLPTLILAFCRGLIIPILPLYARSFGISYSLVGFVLAGEGIGTLSGDIPSGLLIRKIGRKPAMLLGVGGMAASTLALCWAQSVVEIFVYRLIFGIGTSLWNISRHAYIADVTSLYHRGRALSIFGGVNRIGVMLGPVLGGAIGALYSHQAVFLIYAVLAAIPLLTLSIFVGKEDRRAPPFTGLVATGHWGHLLGVLRSHHRQLTTAGTGQLLAQMLRMSRPIIIPLYAADIIGLDDLAVGAIISIAGFVDTAMFYPAGLIMDRYGRKYAIVPCFTLQAVGMALVPFTDSFLGLLLATSFIGLANGIGSGTMMTLGADLAPPGAVSEFLGVWRLIGDLGQTGSPLVVGNIADVLNLYSAAWALSGVGLLAAATFAFLVPETLRAKANSR